MRVLTLSADMPKLHDPVITLGSYDGVHRGHRALLAKLKERAAETGGEATVVTFSPHPRLVLPRGGDFKLLNTLKEKTLLLSEAGIDNLVILPFDEGFARTPSRDFIRDVMVGKLGMKWLVAGYDHHFGRGQEGDADMLEKLGKEFGFGVDRIPKHEYEGDKISSTAVRNLIAEGEMAKAAQLLSEPYMVISDLSGGILVPEEPDKLLPPPGEYPVTVEAADEKTRCTLRMDHEGVAHVEGCPDADDAIVRFE